MAHTSLTFKVQLDPARLEALKLATEFVDSLAMPKPNERGYRDGVWLDAKDRIDYILKVAEWLLTRPTLLSRPPVAHDVPPTHQHRASCDDSAGNHVCGHP